MGMAPRAWRHELGVMGSDVNGPKVMGLMSGLGVAGDEPSLTRKVARVKPSPTSAVRAAVVRIEYALEQSEWGRRAVAPARARPLGAGPIRRQWRASASRFRGHAASLAGEDWRLVRRWGGLQRQGDLVLRPSRRARLARHRDLHRPAEGSGPQPRLRPLCRHCGAWAQRELALSDRQLHQGAGARHEHHGNRRARIERRGP